MQHDIIPFWLLMNINKLLLSQQCTILEEDWKEHTARWSLLDRRQSPGCKRLDIPVIQTSRETVASNSRNKSTAQTRHTFNQGAASPTLQPFPLKICVQKMTHLILQLPCGKKKAEVQIRLMRFWTEALRISKKWDGNHETTRLKKITWHNL